MADANAPRIYPTYRYRNASAMIDWLVNALGFSVHARFEDGGIVQHAELAFGGSLIMLGTARDDAFGAFVGYPGGNGGKATYLVADDADAACARASAAGAEIVEELVDRPYGSREFTCRDPEGNIWCVGTYRPSVAA